MRLFTAIYPDAAASDHLDLALGALGQARMRWVPAAQRHVTLAFHGEVPTGAVEDYVATLAAALTELEPFEIALAGGGSFSARTLYVAVGAGLAPLADLIATVETAAATAQLSPVASSSGRRPHLTLARAGHRDRRDQVNRGRRRAPLADRAADPGVTDWARALSVYRGPAFAVAEVQVVASQLGKGKGGGPLHEVVAVLELGAEDSEAKTRQVS